LSASSSRMMAIQDLAGFLVELSVLDFYMINFRPSTVALAALYNAMDEDPMIVAAAAAAAARNEDSYLLSSLLLFHGYEHLICAGEQGNVLLCRQRLKSLYQEAAVDRPEAAAAHLEADEIKEDLRMTSPTCIISQCNPQQQQQPTGGQQQYHYGYDY